MKSEPTTSSDSQKTNAKTYHTPQVVEWGTILDLTQGSGALAPDEEGGSQAGTHIGPY